MWIPDGALKLIRKLLECFKKGKVRAFVFGGKPQQNSRRCKAGETELLFLKTRDVVERRSGVPVHRQGTAGFGSVPAFS